MALSSSKAKPIARHDDDQGHHRAQTEDLPKFLQEWRLGVTVGEYRELDAGERCLR
jgi:hypothetical protein